MLLLERNSMSDFEMLMVVLTIISLVLISNQNQKNNHSQLLTE
ncbi:hypothetical protein MTQ94_10635 [Staphylococcus agnetis]|nr:hypothetical protein [Staphylococcus agnetis]MCO4342159.1 hypothetical protein [Staphylococcus agnetis]MCO4344228.1 hypothetical protein [Staphylococcus agnetis]MCO4351522.1 hypothetical protein [Staphylococcus agnetis]MCO4351532.1 hypothetical protein [Staphylococcus agnetis]MCO4351575.1 hypothetical protein [Staphylococcus agnetis]